MANNSANLSMLESRLRRQRERSSSSGGGSGGEDDAGDSQQETNRSPKPAPSTGGQDSTTTESDPNDVEGVPGEQARGTAPGGGGTRSSGQNPPGETPEMQEDLDQRLANLSKSRPTGGGTGRTKIEETEAGRHGGFTIPDIADGRGRGQDRAQDISQTEAGRHGGFTIPDIAGGRGQGTDGVAPGSSGQDTSGGVVDTVVDTAQGAAESGASAAEDVVDAGQDATDAVVDTVEGAAESGAEEVRRTVESGNRDVAAGVDMVEGAIGEAEANQRIVDDLTTGGLLSEDNPTQIENVPVVGDVTVVPSEDQLRSASRDWRSYVQENLEGFDPSATVRGPTGTLPENEEADEVVGAATVTATDVPGAVLGLEQGAEIVENAPGYAVSDPEGLAETSVATGRDVTEGAVTAVQENPAEVAAALTGGVLTGVASGAAVSRGARAASGYLRTVGGDRVDPEDLTNPGTVDYYNRGGGDRSDRFPGAEDPDLYETDPAEAVRQQAPDYTPEEVEEYFREYGLDEGVTLKKGVDTEPEGPRGRTASRRTGYEAQEGGYESPGGFFGPELSPRFLGASSQSARMSLRPGLPSLGGRPTGVLARADVENPDADTMDEFVSEIRERSGETTAYTKPAGVGTPGEIEAVIPPGGRFVPVGGSDSGVLGRLGLGSEFYTESGGRRVPVRPVAPESDVDADTDLDDVAEGVVDGGGERLSYYADPGEPPVDRPLPTAPTSPGAGSATDESGTGLDDDEFADYLLGDGDTDSPSPTGEGRPPGTPTDLTTPLTGEYGTEPTGTGGVPPTTDPSSPPSGPTEEPPGGWVDVPEYTPPSEPGTPPPPGGPSSPPSSPGGPGDPYDPPTRPPRDFPEFDVSSDDWERDRQEFLYTSELTDTGILSMDELLGSDEFEGL